MEYSDKLIALHKSVKATSRKSIKIIPEYLGPDFHAATRETDDVFLVRINPMMPLQLEEVILAHELIHVKQLSEGYPQIIVKDLPNYDGISNEFMENYPSQLNTSVLDANVHFQLKSWGYDDSVVRADVSQLFVNMDHFDFCLEHHIVDYVTQFIAYFLVSDVDVRRKALSLLSTYPTLYSTAVQIIDRINPLDLSTAKGTVDCFQVLFDEFRIGKYISIVIFEDGFKELTTSNRGNLIF